MANKLCAPRTYRSRRGIELAELVIHAYKRYDAFKSESSWTAPSGYEILSELSYQWPLQEKDVSGNYFLQIKFPKIGNLGKYLTQDIPMGFIARKGRNVYLIFRGTMTANEWRRDVSAGMVPFYDDEAAKVHDGFLKSYQPFRESIRTCIEQCGSIGNLFIAGHSLGGALSTIAAIDMEELVDSKKICVYTYGSPRVGNIGFVEKYNKLFAKRTVRIANSSDFVVSVPPPIQIPGAVRGYFAHVEQVLSFTLQTEDVEENHSMETYAEVLRQHRRLVSFL